MTPEERYNAALKRAKEEYETAEFHISNFAEELNEYQKQAVETLQCSLEKIFGKSELCPEPEINTFEDLKEAGKMANMFASTTVWKNPEDEREVDFTTECGDSPAERKALATLKIAQLIDVAYGGIVTADEHQNDEAWVYAITYDHNSKHYPFEIILAEKSHDLLSFHSADYDNAERFLCYNEDLVRDFYMMPRKEDEK